MTVFWGAFTPGASDVGGRRHASRIRRALRPAVVASAAVTLATAGCSDGGSKSAAGPVPAHAPKTVAAALVDVNVTDTTKASFAYGDYGAPDLITVDHSLGQIVGFDVRDAAFSLSVGEAPNTVGVLYGRFDPTPIGAKLAVLGYQKTDLGHGETQWQIRDDHQPDTSTKSAALASTKAALNVLRVSKERIAYGGATADLDAALSDRPGSLADDAVVGAVAKCLGKDPSGVFTSGPVPIAYGIGPHGTEQLCVSAPDAATAKAYGETFRQQVRTGTSARTQEPWSEWVTDPKVEGLGGKANIVRLTVKSVDPTRPELAIAQETGDLVTLIGLPEQSDQSDQSGS